MLRKQRADELDKLVDSVAQYMSPEQEDSADEGDERATIPANTSVTLGAQP